MGIIGVILLVVFVIICLLIIALVLVQNEGWGRSWRFVIRRQQFCLRFPISECSYPRHIRRGYSVFRFRLFLAFINKSPSDKGIEAAARQAQIESSDTEWFLEESAEDASVETGTAPADAAAAE